MGEIADMMIEGILDSETGEFIDDDLSRSGGPGFPRTMNDRNGTIHKYSSAVNGIKKYLKMNTRLEKKDMHTYCVKYLTQGLNHSFPEVPSWEEVAEIIQRDFDLFTKYVNNNTK